MKAAVLYGKEDLRVEERAIPEINANEVLLKVKASAICGTDVRMFKNGLPGGSVAPVIPGHELSGIVEKAGKNVTACREGMRAAVAPNMGCGFCGDCIRGNSHMCKNYRALGINLDGGFAEYVRIPEAAVRCGNIMELSGNVSFPEAAVTEALSCVYNGIEQCRIQPGDFVCVIGSGPIGVMHAMMAKMSGAARVYVSDISKERLQSLKEIDPSFIPVQGGIKEYAREHTGGHGMDVVITACPVPSAQQDATEIAATYGRICFFGGLPESAKIVPIDTNAIHYRQLIVTGSTRASLRQFKAALGFVTAGIIDVKKLITATYPLEDIHAGFSSAMQAKGFKNIIEM